MQTFSFSFGLLTLSTLLWLLVLPKIDCFNFNFSNFSDKVHATNEIYLSSNSSFNLGAIQVTPDVNGASMANKAGRALYKEPFLLWSKGYSASFSTSFILNIQNHTVPGGEGIAFIFTASPSVDDIVGSDGQWLGIINQKMNGSLSAQTVAIEFDTRKSYPEDIDDNHIGLDINTIYSRIQIPLRKFGINISSGNDTFVRIEYDGQQKKLNVFLQNIIKPVLSADIDLSEYLPREIYVGFSASTSDLTQLNCVKGWDFNGTEKRVESKLWIWILIPLLGVVVLFGIGFSIYWKIKLERERLEEADAYPISIEEAIRGSSTAPRKFKLKEVSKATGNFSPKNKLGKGGFGTVYKGKIQDKEIAVKKVSKKSTQGKAEFIAEVTTIGNLRHKNLVRLIGWCYERREYLLIYEFLPNGSLDKYIFDNKSTDILGWNTRLSVITGTAHALDYLHNGCEEKILHRDIKSSNIMLDSEFNPKLGDFGLARTIKLSDQTHHSTKEVAGTPGYMAPEVMLASRFTVESDVYAFGIVILEVACGRRPAGPNENNIVSWVWDLHRKERIVDAADKRLNGDFAKEIMESVLILGLACCHPNPNKRPDMKVVLQVLKGEAIPPPVPTERPAFMWPPLPPSFKELDISLGQISPFTDLSGR